MKFIRWLLSQHHYDRFIVFLMMFLSGSVFADDDPFPNIDIQGGDVVQAVGTNMEWYDYDAGGYWCDYASFA